MNRSPITLLKAALLLVLPVTSFAQSIELQAISDFTNRESGAVPYYLDVVADVNALAINAANPDYRNKFARAEHEFLGPDGIYNITINALGEIDGDGTYRLLIDGIVQGVAVNTPVSEDYVVMPHKFEGIALTAPTTIGIESSAVSNNMIPEGDGFAFARGRWRSVVLENTAAQLQATDSVVDLGISLSTIKNLVRQGSSAPFIVSVINNSQTTTATSPKVEFFLPDTALFTGSDVCVPDSGVVRCLLPELPPGATTTVSISAVINTVGWISMSAAIGSDQSDSDRTNNIDFLSFNSMEAIVDSETTNAGNTSVDNNVTTSGDSTASGAVGFPVALLLLLTSLVRVKLTRHYDDDKSTLRAR